MSDDRKNRSSKPTPADLEAAERLRAAWAKRPRGLTQEKMGVLLGASQSAVSHYLSGRNALNYRVLMLFAQALDIDPIAIRDDLPEQALASSGKFSAAPPIKGKPSDEVTSLLLELTPDRLQRAPEHIRKMVGQAMMTYALHPEDALSILRSAHALLKGAK